MGAMRGLRPLSWLLLVLVPLAQPAEPPAWLPVNEDGNLLADSCNEADAACLAMSPHDRLGLEAIKSLHRQLDDDADGDVDLTETNDFLREELKYDSGYEKRQKAFHHNNDMHISVRELWEAWLRSEVHNWTVEQTSEWLATNVELPQYVGLFVQHKVNGATLPRLAVDNMYYLSQTLGIKDPIHKQKISLKAMDVVLFGPPKENHSYWKDLSLVTLIIGTLIGSWYVYLQRKKFKCHLQRMMKDMESLHRAELALENVQKELELTRLQQENVVTEKQNLERRLQEAGGDTSSLHSSYSDLEVSQLKAEIDMLRTELTIAESELKDRCWSPPVGLQQWLQLTHEIENKAYTKKKIAAEKQLQQAREACEKLRKKRSSLVGAFVSTHGKSIDDVDRSIVEARTSLNEVTQELQERVHRWKQIELLCGFNIINNNGLQYLESSLYRSANGGRGVSFKNLGRMSSQDDLDDESSSVYSPSPGYHDVVGMPVCREAADSSGSEASRPEEEEAAIAAPPTLAAARSIQFTVGGEVANWASEEQLLHHHQHHHPQRPNSNNSQQQWRQRSHHNNNGSAMFRSVSQDAAVALNDQQHQHQQQQQQQQQQHQHHFFSGDGSPMHSKSSQSDPCLEQQPQQSSKKAAKNSSTASAATTKPEEDYCSTDSSVVEEEIKRRRRKLHFPQFSRRKAKPE